MEKKKQVFRDILINGLGGIVTSVILFVYGKISGSISFEASSNIYKVIAGTLYIALSGLVVYVFRAKRPAIVSPQHLVSKFSDNQKKWAGLFGFACDFCVYLVLIF
ncbi:MAG: hypothetical protein IPL71_21660 [Anaerolineales bacterium]|uniref:hypothetical protein n=1 Tax=Candidatus Villigracilis proximus TaxID=3140683 RepID=UPI00313472F0|nr:hypothetical protein [Anaerolineales bacterium]